MTKQNSTVLKGIFREVKMMMMVVFAFSALFITACSSNAQENEDASQTKTEETTAAPANDDAEDAAASASANDGKGVGPFADKTVTVGADIDAAMATKGKTQFETKCTACHKLGTEKYVGPGLKGVTERRKPEWIMNMIINPSGMTAEDPTAKELLAEHLTQMAKQDVSEDDTRAILEYLRQNDKN
jgi:mono/diheme cytochrome c family protein